MHLKSALLATMLTIGLAGAAGAVTINGPHSSLPCTTCHQGDKMTAPAKETCLTCHESYATHQGDDAQPPRLAPRGA